MSCTLGIACYRGEYYWDKEEEKEARVICTWNNLMQGWVFLGHPAKKGGKDEVNLAQPSARLGIPGSRKKRMRQE